MVTRHRHPKRLRRFWFPALTIAFLGYFGYHAFHGAYGILALGMMEEERARLIVELDKLREEQAALNRRVGFLRPDSLDADIVDVEARASLNMLRPDEVVISFGATQHSPQ